MYTQLVIIMKINILLKITIGILFSLNIYLGYLLRGIQMKMNREISALVLKNKIDSVKFDKTQKLLRFEYLLEEELINQIPEYFGFQGINHIMVLFSEKHCQSCVKEIIMNFSYLKQVTGFDRFAILGVFQDSLTFALTAENLDAEFTHLYLGPFNKNSVKLNSPVVFTIDMEGRIGYFFSPDVYPEIRQWYFMDLLKRYCIQMI